MARFTEKEKEQIITVFGEKTKFNGNLKFTEELHIAGSFTGTIDAQGALVLKKGSTCDTVFIKAASIIVEGVVQGPMTAGDRIEMRTGSVVKGDISASRLRIADGVTFEGSVEMIRTNTDIDLFSTRTDVLKAQIRSEESR